MPERLRGVITTRRYINPHLLYLTIQYSHVQQFETGYTAVAAVPE